MERDLMAAVARMHNDHSIVQPADGQTRLVAELDALQARGELTKAAVSAVAAKMPAQFLKQNRFDSASQYARLLWESVSTASARDKIASSSSTTHFHAPVQAGVLQTATGSAAQWIGDQQTLAVGGQFMRALSEAKAAAEIELSEDSNRDHALAIIEAVEVEAKKPNADKGKIMRLLGPMAKWTGERFTKAIDTAIEVVVKGGLGQPMG